MKNNLTNIQKYLPLIVFSTAFSSSVAFTANVENKPKVTVAEIKTILDKKRIIVPVKIEAKIQSVVTSDIEGHVTRIVKPLGSSVKAGETVLFLENKDPGFTFAAVPVKSPVSGVVSQVYTSQMAKVGRNEKLFTVINPKSIKLTAEFASQDLNILKTGLIGSFQTHSGADKSFSIKITALSPLIDPRTGTASTEFEFIDNQTGVPPIGSIGQATFEISQGEILVVPEASLIYQDGKPLIRVIKNKNQFDKKSVELGEQRDSSFVVKKGLIPGEQIVVRSSRPLKEGDTLDIEPSEAKDTK